MTMRELSYYQHPLPAEFVKHMTDDTGLIERDRDIVLLFRHKTGSTQFYADESGLPIKTFNNVADAIHRRMMAELLRLAVIGWQAERK